MRRIITLSTLLLAASLILSSCVTIDFGDSGLRSVRGNGNIVSEERPVSGIQRVALYGIGNVEISIGDSESLFIEAEDNLMEYITSEVDNGVLELRTRNLINMRPSKDIRYIVTVKSVSGLEILGSGNITMDSAETSDMRLLIAGSGDITIVDLTADSLDVTIPGSGTIKLSGETGQQTINIAGSGKYLAEDLASQSADINLAGSGDLRIWVKESLDIRILGSGDIRYYGSPAVTQTVLGSGDIQSLGDK